MFFLEQFCSYNIFPFNHGIICYYDPQFRIKTNPLANAFHLNNGCFILTNCIILIGDHAYVLFPPFAIFI